MVEENWVKVLEINRLNKLEENMKIYHPIEELLKEKGINYKYKIEEGLNYDEIINVKGVKNIFFVNLYVESKNEKRVQQIIEEYEKTNFIQEELLPEELREAEEVEEENVEKTIPQIILPYIYVVLFGIIVIILTFANFEYMISRIIGTVVGIIIIIYAIISIIKRITERKK